jgi:hypothetical protein
MDKIDLWPTTIYQSNLDIDNCKLLQALILSNEAMGITPEDMIQSGEFNMVLDLIKDVGNATIIDAWIRLAESDHNINNSFEIHCDSHKGTDYIGILWLSGDENRGGDLMLYDPAWRNPQHLRFENQQQYNLRHRLKFKIGELILFPSNVWHEVTSYYGTEKRISLNFAINIDGPNN